jgi:hypothetical protein
MQLYVECVVISTSIGAVLVSVKGMFCLQQGLSGETVRFIADSCQHLKKLSLVVFNQICDDDAIHVTKKLGKQLQTLVLYGADLTDVAYLYLHKCARYLSLNKYAR